MALMKNPLVSIILPTYNGERYIGESVASIISQTYSNWELIIYNFKRSHQKILLTGVKNTRIIHYLGLNNSLIANMRKKSPIFCERNLISELWWIISSTFEGQK